MNMRLLATYVAEVKAQIYRHEEGFAFLVLADFSDDLRRNAATSRIAVCRRWLAHYRKLTFQSIEPVKAKKSA